MREKANVGRASIHYEAADIKILSLSEGQPQVKWNKDCLLQEGQLQKGGNEQKPFE
jgi:hypothetical protein